MHQWKSSYNLHDVINFLSFILNVPMPKSLNFQNFSIINQKVYGVTMEAIPCQSFNHCYSNKKKMSISTFVVIWIFTEKEKKKPKRIYSEGKHAFSWTLPFLFHKDYIFTLVERNNINEIAFSALSGIIYVIVTH